MAPAPGCFGAPGTPGRDRGEGVGGSPCAPGWGRSEQSVRTGMGPLGVSENFGSQGDRALRAHRYRLRFGLSVRTGVDPIGLSPCAPGRLRFGLSKDTATGSGSGFPCAPGWLRFGLSKDTGTGSGSGSPFAPVLLAQDPRCAPAGQALYELGTSPAPPGPPRGIPGLWGLRRRGSPGQLDPGLGPWDSPTALQPHCSPTPGGGSFPAPLPRDGAVLLPSPPLTASPPWDGAGFLPHCPGVGQMCPRWSSPPAPLPGKGAPSFCPDGAAPLPHCPPALLPHCPGMGQPPKSAPLHSLQPLAPGLPNFGVWRGGTQPHKTNSGLPDAPPHPAQDFYGGLARAGLRLSIGTVTSSQMHEEKQ